MDPMQMMIADLAQQVAEKAIAVAEWKARATLAEHSLMEIKAAQEDGAEEGSEVAPVVSLVPKDDEDNETDGS